MPSSEGRNWIAVSSATSSLGLISRAGLGLSVGSISCGTKVDDGFIITSWRNVARAARSAA